QRLADAALQTQVLQHRLGSAALGFEAHRVDHRIHTAATRGLFDDGRCGVVVLIEIDRQHAVGTRGEFQPVLVVVHHEDVFGPQQPGAGGGHPGNKARTVDGHTAPRHDPDYDHRLLCGSPAIGENETILSIN